jgi:hypothetical protein
VKNASGSWVGWGLGDTDPKVTAIKEFLAKKFSYASALDTSPVYNAALAAVVSGMQGKYGLPSTGIFDYATGVKCGFYKTAPKVLPVYFSVEGHMSNMWSGPVADTGTQLAAEGRVHHQPIGYDNGALPFDNASGENEVARLVGSQVLDDGTPFPTGTKWALSGFSQGGIVISDFYIDHLLPGCDLAWRTPDLLGVLAYGNPCRQTGSVAPWSVAQAGPAANSGLDPLKRFGLPGFPAKPANWMDVYRKGDIFSDNEPTKEGQVKAAVYQAVARSDFFSNPYSILSQIADLFTVPFDEVWAMFQAIVSGIGFILPGQPNPHYAAWNIDGGLSWLRSILP